MSNYREEEDPFEEDIVFDQAGLLNNSSKRNSAIRRVSSGKCGLFSKTLGLCGAFFGLGLCIAIPGPMFLSPSITLDPDVSPVSSIYAARSCGYLIGAIIGGFLFDHFNRLFLLFISLLLTSIFIIVVPWCQIYWLLQACMVLLGISMGFLDTGGNVLCLDLWGRNSAPFMQALHFSFGLGAFVAPLLAAPFLQSPLMPNHAINSLSQFPQVPKNIDQLHPFRLDSLRTKREVGGVLNGTNISAIAFQNITHDTSMYATTLADSLSDKPNYLVNVMATTERINAVPTQHIPKPKPSKTDGSKLGPENWDRIHVGKPPLSDLIPPSTNLPSTSFSSQMQLVTNPSQILLMSFNSTMYTVLVTSPAPEAKPTEHDSVSSELSTSSVVQEPTVSGIISSVNNWSGNEIVTVSHQLAPAIDQQSTVTKELHYHDKGTDLKNIPFKPNDKDNGENDINDPGYNQEADGENDEIVYAEDSNGGSDHNDGLYSQYPVADNGNNDQADAIVTRGGGLENDYENNSKLDVLPDLSSKENRNIDLNDSSTSASTQQTLATSVVPPTKRVHHLKPGTYDNDTEDINSIFSLFASGIEKYGLSKLQFTYLIVGLFVFVISLIFLGFLCHNPRDPKSKQEEGQGSKKVINPSLSASFVCVMSTFLLLYVGLEVAFGQMVIAYAVNSNLQLMQVTGSLLAASFWGTFSIARFASIFTSSGLSPVSMMFLNFFLCTSGTIVLSAMGNSFEWALWLGTILLAIGLASIFPTSILWIERYIHVTNKVAAVFVIAVTLGQMICPIIVYHLMMLNPTLLMHSCLVINILCILFFIIMWKIASKLGEKYCVVNNNGYQLANQNEEDDDLIEMSPSRNRLLLARHSVPPEHRSLLNGNSTHLP